MADGVWEQRVFKALVDSLQADHDYEVYVKGSVNGIGNSAANWTATFSTRFGNMSIPLTDTFYATPWLVFARKLTSILRTDPFTFTSWQLGVRGSGEQSANSTCVV